MQNLIKFLASKLYTTMFQKGMYINPSYSFDMGLKTPNSSKKKGILAPSYPEKKSVAWHVC